VAVVVGYAVFAASSDAVFRFTGHEPHEAASPLFKMASIAAGVIFAFIGGYIAGWIGKRHTLAHGVAVAVLIALGAGMSLASTLGHGAIWTQVAALTLMVPSAVLGGWLRAPASSTKA
jgi:hypothetical protein